MRWDVKMGRNFLVSLCMSLLCWSNFIWNREVSFGNWLMVQNSSAWSLPLIIWWKIECPRLVLKGKGQKPFLLKCGRTAFWVKKIQFNFITLSCICWALVSHWGEVKNIEICKLLASIPKSQSRRGRVKNFCCTKKTERARRIKGGFRTRNINLEQLEFTRIWKTLTDVLFICLKSTRVYCLLERQMLFTRKRFATGKGVRSSATLISRLGSTVCDQLWRVFVQRLVWVENSQITL